MKKIRLGYSSPVASSDPPIGESEVVAIIEHERGSTRSGTSADGTTWSREMKCDYGYLTVGPDAKPLIGADGEALDVFVGEYGFSGMCYLIDQLKDNGLFDEHKVVSGVSGYGEEGKENAKALYLSNYPDGWNRCGAITEIPIYELATYFRNRDLADNPAGLPYRNAKDGLAYYCNFCPNCAESCFDGKMPMVAECPKCGTDLHFVDGYAKRDAQLAKLASVAETIRHCGDSGACYFDADSGAVFWSMADSDGDGVEFDSPNQIEKKFLSLSFVKLFECESESGPPNGYVTVEYDRSKNPGRVVNTDSATVAESDSCDGPFSQETSGESVIIEDFGAVGDKASSRPGVLLRVRQYAMQADALNKNKRIYPRNVVQKAINELRPDIPSGVVISEMEHPDVVKDAGGSDQFIDGGRKQKTGRVTLVSDVGADGRVFIERDIVDTPAGRKVADAIRKGKPFGISTRFKMRGHRATLKDGTSAIIADEMHIDVWDDVENPAVDGAGHQFELLSDSVKAELGISNPTPNTQHLIPDPSIIATPVTSPDVAPTPTGDNLSTSHNAPNTSARKESRVKDNLLKRISALIALASVGASAVNLRTERDAISDTLKLLIDSNADQADITEVATAALAADAILVNIPGYVSSNPAPVGVAGNATGTNAGGGYAANTGNGAATPDTDPKKVDIAAHNASADAVTEAMKQAGLTPELIQTVKDMNAAKAQATADAERKTAVDAIIEEAKGENGVLHGLDSAAQDFIVTNVVAGNPVPEAVASLLATHCDSYSRFATAERLRGNGLIGNAQGNSVNNPGTEVHQGSHVAVVRETPVWMSGTDAILRASDEVMATTNACPINPHSPLQKSIRASNKRLIMPILDGIAMAAHGAKSWSEFAAKADAMVTSGDGVIEDATIKSFGDSLKTLEARMDSTTLSNLYNQPSILAAIVVQQFQDMTFLNLVSTIGGSNVEGVSEWMKFKGSQQFNVGSVLRLAIETFTAPTGYGAQSARRSGRGRVPEGIGIPEATVDVRWQSFSAYWRRLAFSVTHEGIKNMGRGPLNYPTIARHMAHVGWYNGRLLDLELADEMLLVSDEYNAVAITGESVTLANNSVYGSGGSISVNLNTSKTASQTIATGDASVTYGANVLAAVRVKGLLATTSVNAGTYCGTALGTSPIVRPRVTSNIDTNGAVTSTTTNAVSVTAPVSAVEGYLDENGVIQDMPGGATATWALDAINGVIVFASGVTGASGIATTAVTVSYSYATNYDEFLSGTTSYGTGVTRSQYLDGLVKQLDATGAYMSSSPRFVHPDFAFSSVTAAVDFKGANIFAPLFAQPGTSMGLTNDSFYAQRNGIEIGEHNAPWADGDKSILLGRRGSTKLGIEVPFEVRGPYGKQNSSGQIIAQDIYYGEASQVIATPQVTNPSTGAITQPPYRKIIRR